MTSERLTAAARPAGLPPAGMPGSASRRRADGSGRMFDGISAQYDRLNRLLSLGQDRRWRRLMVQALQLPEGARVLDLATGTGDVVLELLRQRPSAEVHAVDPSPGMLALASRKLGARPRVTLLEGRAESLPFAERCFDGATIAFGIRNVPARVHALRELCRVLVPGGRLAVLELSWPRGGVLAPFARLHVRFLVPLLGGLLSSSEEYRYLGRSIAAFPSPERFEGELHDAGLEPERTRVLTAGACMLYVARRPTEGGAS